MNRIRSIGIAASLAAVIVVPTFAQNPPGRASTTAKASQPSATTDATVPVGADKTQDEWRARTLIGAAVYDDNGRRSLPSTIC